MLKRICKWAAPAFLLLFLLLALYGAVRPWPPAAEALSIYKGQTPILVGAGFKSTSSSTQTHRSYILFPAVVGDLSIVTVRQIDQSPVQVQAEPFALIPLLIWLGLCAVGTWWFWLSKGGANVT
jgi:hypothetical protein